MGILSSIGSVFKAITSPLGVLEDWAKEPLKRWDHKRQEASKDRDVERRIREQTGVEEVRARLERENASHASELEIRMKTEIERINTETQQWAKDKEFERMRLVTEAMMQYQERLTTANLRISKSLGMMGIELRDKAQALILEKTLEYKRIQDQATKDSKEEFVYILETFSSNERVLNIMIDNSAKKLASIVDTTSKFLEELSIDIQNLNKNIDRLTELGHQHALKQLDRFNTSLAPTIGQGQEQRQIEEASYTELPYE